MTVGKSFRIAFIVLVTLVAALFIPPIIIDSVHRGLYDPSRGIDRGVAAIVAILGGLSYGVIFTLGFARIRKIFRENTPSSSTSPFIHEIKDFGQFLKISCIILVISLTAIMTAQNMVLLYQKL
jgi:hypothetical protein